MSKREIRKRLRDEYHYPGFYPSRYVETAESDSGALIVRLSRRSKKRYAERAVRSTVVGTTARCSERGTYRVLVCVSIWNLSFAESGAESAAW